MKKRYVVLVLAGLVLPILYFAYQQVASSQHDEALSACISKFEKIRAETANIKPVNLYPFQQGYQQLGYLDQKGKVVIQPQFTEARNFYQGRALVADKNWYKGFINSLGEIVIPYKFIWVSDFVDGIAVFSGTRENPDQEGFIDLNGNVLLKFSGANPDVYFIGFKKGRAKVYVNEADMPWGFLVPSGNPVPKIYGYVDCTGKVMLEK
jgi:hypothetical protein